MKVFTGNSTENFKLDIHKKSRYGFTAVFFATKIDLAELFAQHSAKENYKNEYFIYEATLPDHIHTVDFKGQKSYCSDFRKLIIDAQKSGISILKITNVLDYPSENQFKLNDSDIICVFDLKLIRNLTLAKKVTLNEPYRTTIAQPTLGIFGKEMDDKRKEILSKNFSKELENVKALSK